MSIIEKDINMKIWIDYEKINDEWCVYSRKFYKDKNNIPHDIGGFCKVKDLEELSSNPFFKPRYFEKEEDRKFNLDLSQPIKEIEPMRLVLVRESFVEKFRKDSRNYYKNKDKQGTKYIFYHDFLYYFRKYKEEGMLLVDIKKDLLMRDVINNKYLPHAVLFDSFSEEKIKSSSYELDKVKAILKDREDFEYLTTVHSNMRFMPNINDEIINFVWYPTNEDWNKYMQDVFDNGTLDKPETWCLKHILDLSKAKKEEIKSCLFCRMKTDCKLGNHIFEENNAICKKCRQEKKL